MTIPANTDDLAALVRREVEGWLRTGALSGHLIAALTTALHAHYAEREQHDAAQAECERLRVELSAMTTARGIAHRDWQQALGQLHDTDQLRAQLDAAEQRFSALAHEVHYGRPPSTDHARQVAAQCASRIVAGGDVEWDSNDDAVDLFTRLYNTVLASLRAPEPVRAESSNTDTYIARCIVCRVPKTLCTSGYCQTCHPRPSPHAACAFATPAEEQP